MSDDRFNSLARNGKDLDLGRGDNFHERSLGDAHAPHPNLAGGLDPFVVQRARVQNAR